MRRCSIGIYGESDGVPAVDDALVSVMWRWRETIDSLPSRRRSPRRAFVAVAPGAVTRVVTLCGADVVWHLRSWCLVSAPSSVGTY